MYTDIVQQWYKPLTFLKGSEVLLCEKEHKKYVAKANNKINFYKIAELKRLLTHINNYAFEHTIIPNIVFVSPKGSPIPYYITEYIEGAFLPWSEHDNEYRWGKNINIGYASKVYKSIVELEKVDIDWFALWEDYKNKYFSINKRLKMFYDKHIISLELVNNIERLFEKYKTNYFNNIMVSNLDLYFRNLIFAPNGKTAIIDWEWPPTCDSFGLQCKEELLMYFYVTMFGNKEFQEELLKLYRARNDFEPEKFRIGLVLSCLLDMELWINSVSSKKAFERYLDMINRHLSIIS